MFRQSKPYYGGIFGLRAQLTKEERETMSEKYTVITITPDTCRSGIGIVDDHSLMLVAYRYSKDLSDGVAVATRFTRNKDYEFTDEMLGKITEFVHKACTMYGKPIDGSRVIISIIPGVDTTAAVCRNYAFQECC